MSSLVVGFEENGKGSEGNVLSNTFPLPPSHHLCACGQQSPNPSPLWSIDCLHTPSPKETLSLSTPGNMQYLEPANRGV